MLEDFSSNSKVATAAKKRTSRDQAESIAEPTTSQIHSQGMVFADKSWLEKPRGSREFYDGDISDDEDPLPHDLADSDVEDLINDDDGVEKMADVARAHGGDGGGEDPSRPPPTSFGCAGCFINRGKGKRKPNLGGVKAGRKTRERTRNQVLKDAVAANKGRPIEIGFEDRADNTVVPTGPYSTQWGNYFGEMIRSIPLYHPSWQKVPAGDKARLMATLGTLFDLRPHMDSSRWTEIYEGINMHTAAE
ncbi:hypothetical protein Tco_0339588 [Tanacetum coccineum]